MILLNHNPNNPVGIISRYCWHSRVSLARYASVPDRAKQRIVVLGSGWAGFQLSRGLDKTKYDVVVVSPRNYFVFTPLLASTAVGTLEFRCVVEPVKSDQVEFYEARCDSIDFVKKELVCTSTLEDFQNTFPLSYDILAIAIGAVSNTFNIPGVAEHAYFLKDIGDARKIRTRIMECFEHASQPNISDQEKRDKLHFVVVGGGPTGVEFLAELHDYVTEDVLELYPTLRPFVSMTILDVGKTLLGSFDKKLSEYTSNRFTRKGIHVKLGARVAEVQAKHITLSSGEVIPNGLLVWSTGVSPVPLIKQLDLPKDKAMGRLLTDEYMRVIDKDGKPLDKVLALGDCATISNFLLPTTAQVANQKAVWLRGALNKLEMDKWPTTVDNSVVRPFSYLHLGSLAYVGKWKAVVDVHDPMKKAEKDDGQIVSTFVPSTGWGAWLFWRSAYFTMSVSTKNKILIPMFWLLTWIFGRDISRLK